MADGHGGYRKPANPAPVSGPGVFSQRTDGRQPILDLPNAGYGENAQFRADEHGAPIPQASALPSAGPSGAPAAGGAPTDAQGNALNPPTPLTGGSLLPGTPVTDGAASGPGAGPEALHMPNPVQSQHQSALSVMQSLAASPNASPAIRFMVSSLQQGF
ncbi:MAG: hypothetical protein KGL35_25780 [Bradyrhizobium sp.]|nr:hypothetical protein [Bradyrhizobium sp.]